MFGSAHRGASAYATVGVETGVVAASPHKLIVMLFEGALASLALALQHLKSEKINIEAKGAAISKAIDIIESGLRASLDLNVGGEIAANLDNLYVYMGNRLLIANLKNDPNAIEEVRRLLSELKSAWEAIEQAPAPQMETPPQAYANDPLTPSASRLMKA
jgi:flagellar protein FliS